MSYTYDGSLHIQLFLTFSPVKPFIDSDTKLVSYFYVTEHETTSVVLYQWSLSEQARLGSVTCL